MSSFCCRLSTNINNGIAVQLIEAKAEKLKFNIMLLDSRTVAEKYSNIWQSLNDEGLDLLLYVDPVLSFPDVEPLDTYKEVYDYHNMMFGMIKEIPLSEVIVKSEMSHQTSIPYNKVYSVNVYTVHDELIFTHKIATNSSDLITRIDVQECNYAEIRDKYSATEDSGEQQTINFHSDE